VEQLAAMEKEVRNRALVWFQAVCELWVRVRVRVREALVKDTPSGSFTLN
jgi:hypothetical protein